MYAWVSRRLSLKTISDMIGICACHPCAGDMIPERTVCRLQIRKPWSNQPTWWFNHNLRCNMTYTYHLGFFEYVDRPRKLKALPANLQQLNNRFGCDRRWRIHPPNANFRTNTCDIQHGDISSKSRVSYFQRTQFHHFDQWGVVNLKTWSLFRGYAVFV